MKGTDEQRYELGFKLGKGANLGVTKLGDSTYETLSDLFLDGWFSDTFMDGYLKGLAEYKTRHLLLGKAKSIGTYVR
jgi:hypothetical protein